MTLWLQSEIMSQWGIYCVRGLVCVAFPKHGPGSQLSASHKEGKVLFFKREDSPREDESRTNPRIPRWRPGSCFCRTVRAGPVFMHSLFFPPLLDESSEVLVCSSFCLSSALMLIRNRSWSTVGYIMFLCFVFAFHCCLNMVKVPL